MSHVDDGTLHALLDGALRAHEPDRADRVEAHLDACADCRARLEEAAALRDRAGDILADLDAVLAAETTAGRGPGADRGAGAAGAGRLDEPIPDFQDVLARAGAAALPTAGTDQRTGLRRRVAWTRGLAWAATIVVALGTGYLVRDLADPTGVVPRAATVERSDRAAGAMDADAAEGERVEAGDPEPAAGVAEETAAGEATVQQAAPDDARPEARAATDAGRGAAEGQPAAGGDPSVMDEAAGAAMKARQAAPQAAAERETADADAVAPAPAAGGEVTAGDVTGDARWRTASLEEAEAGAGPLLVLPGATLAAIEVAGDGSVRTRQRLSDGVEVLVTQNGLETVVVQRDVPVSAGGDPVSEAAPATLLDRAGEEQVQLRAVQAMEPTEAVPTLVGLDLDSAAATVPAPVTVTVLRDGRSLTLTAQLPEDVLLALAATAAPRTR